MVAVVPDCLECRHQRLHLAGEKPARPAVHGAEPRIRRGGRPLCRRIARCDPPTPASPWSVDIAELTAANHLVREAAAQLAADSGAARVLVAEVATITRSLSGIAIDSRQAATS